jgi:hypothetical protein
MERGGRLQFSSLVAAQGAAKVIFDSADHHLIDFQTGLAQKAAATHIGMHVAWLTLRGLGSPELDGYLEDPKARRISCAGFMTDACDGKFAAADANPEDAAFTHQ